MKHAYLILAHNNFYVLEKLIALIDDERNDIFLHIDSKCKDFNFLSVKSLSQKSNTYVIDKRFDISWGQFSLVEAELELFAEAYHRGVQIFSSTIR